MPTLRTLFVLSIIALAAPARADVPPPEVELCAGKKVGDTCENNGVCQESSCGRATPDGVVSYPCVQCVPGAAPASSSRNCSGAPEGLAMGLVGLLALGLRRRLA